MKLAAKIAQARKNKGLTQEELADLAKVTVRTIQRIESGDSIPRAYTIRTLAQALGVSFEDLSRPDDTEQLPDDTSTVAIKRDLEAEKYFLTILCLSCCSYLVIPLVHFLIPVYLLRKSKKNHPTTIAFARKMIRQQVYWVIALCFLLILTVAYNFIVVLHFGGHYLLHYWWTVFTMYLLNAVVIVTHLRRINRLELVPGPTM